MKDVLDADSFVILPNNPADQIKFNVTEQNATLSIDAETLASGRYPISTSNETIGYLIKHDDNIELHLDTPHSPIILQGKLTSSHIAIASNAALMIDAGLKSQNIEITCPELTMNTPLNCQGNVKLNIAGQLNVEQKIQAERVQIDCENADIKNVIKANIINAVTKNTLNNQKKILGRHYLSLQTKSLINDGDIAGALRLTATDQIINRGSLSTTSASKFKTNNFVNLGKINCRAKTSLYAENYAAGDQSQLSINKFFKFIGKEFYCAGEMKGHAPIYFDAQNWRNAGKIQFVGPGYIHAKNLSVQKNGEFTWASSSIPSSDYSSNENICVLKIDDTLLLREDAALNLQDNVTTAQRILTAPQSQLNANKSFFQAELFNTEGNLNLAEATLKGVFFKSSGKNTLNDSSLEMQRRFAQLKSADSVLTHTRISARNIENEGSLNLQDKSYLHSTALTNQNKLSLANSFIEADNIITTENATTTSKEASLWNIHQSAQLKGETNFEKTAVQSQAFHNQGVMQTDASLFDVKKRFENETQASLKARQSEFQTKIMNLAGSYDFQKSHLQNNFTHFSAGQGALSNSELATNFYDLTKEAKLTIDDVQVHSEDMRLAGNQSMHRTLIDAQTLYQPKGKMTADQSNIQIKKAVLTEPGSQLHLQQSVLNAGDGAGVFAGYTQLKKSLVEFANGDLHTTWTDQSKIKSQDQLILSKDQLFDQSILETGQIAVTGNAAFNNHSGVHIEKDAVLTPDATVSLKQSQWNSNGDWSNYGKFVLEQAKVAGKTLYNNKKFNLDRSGMVLAESLSTGHHSKMDLQESSVTAKSMQLQHKLQSKQTSLTAQENIDFDFGSQSQFDRSMLTAGQKITIDQSATVGGESLSVKAKELNNLGKISFEKGFSADVDYLVNYDGSINGGLITQLDANVALYNRGQIKAANVIINTPILINHAGDICGNDYLIANSLVGVNLCGSERSFNLLQNSLLDLNYGLVLPAMPTSLAAIFSWQHALSSSAMIASNVFPHLRNIINLGYFTLSAGLPLIYQTGKKIYDISTHQAPMPSFSDLKNLRWKDVLPAIVAMKSLFVVGANMQVLIANLPGEMSEFNWQQLNSDARQFDYHFVIDGISDIVLPVNSSEAIASINQGLRLNGNLLQNNYFASNFGAEIGLANNTHYAKYLDNQGLILGNQVSLAGKQLKNRGILVDFAQMNLQFDDIVNAENARLYARNANIYTHSFINLGYQSFRNANIATDHFATYGSDTYANTTIQASADIEMASQASLTGNLNLFSNQVNIPEQASIEGPHELFVSAKEQGALAGGMHVKNLLYDAPVENPLDFINQKNQYQRIQVDDNFAYKTQDQLTFNDSITDRQCNVAIIGKNIVINHDQNTDYDLYFEATDGDVAANNAMHARNLALKASHDINTQANDYTAVHNINFYAGNNYTNHGGHVYAQSDTFITAEQGDIDNIAGVLRADNHIQLVAGHDLYNRVTERDVQGRFDVIKEWKPATIAGGSGQGYNDTGVYIKSGNKTFNDASIINAKTDIIIEADGGFESTARAHTYLENKKTKKSGLFKNKKKTKLTYDTLVIKPEISSQDGRICIYSANGDIRSVATNFSAPLETTLAAKGKVELLDLVVSKTTINKSSSFWGFTHSKEKHYTESSVPTVVINPTNTNIVSLESDVIMRNPIIVGPGHLSVYAGHNIQLEETILNNYYSKESKGFYISVAGIPVFKSNSDAPSGLPRLQADSTYQHLEQLANSNGAAETLLNTWNTGIDLANTGNSLVQGIRNEDWSELFNHYGVGEFNPSASFNSTHKKERLDYQTRGGGYIQVGSAEFVAGNDMTVTGLPITIQGDCSIKAKQFTQQGIYLDSRYSSSSSQVGVSVGAKAHLYDVNVSGSKAKQTSHQLLNQQFNVGGTLSIDVDNWNIQGANTNVGHVQGKVKKLFIESQTSQQTASQSSYSASTDGKFSVSKSKSKQQIIDMPSSLTVRDSINGNDPNEFYVKDLHLRGGKILSNGVVNLNPETITAEDVVEYSHSKGFSFSGNINTLFPKPSNPHFIDTKDDKAKQIATLPVSVTEQHYKAKQSAVIHGEQGTNIAADKITGNLVTNSSDGKQILKNEHHEYRLEIPVVDQATLQQMKDNLSWSLNKLGVSDDSKTAYVDKILAFEKLHTPEEVKKYIEKINVMAQLSDAVYKDGNLPDGYELVAEYIDPNYDARVKIYRNEEDHSIVIAFNGTDSYKIVKKEDVPIGLGKTPPGYDSNVHDFIEANIEKYKNDYDISFTGHSLGASKASLASDEFGYKAYTFDNPGIYDGDQSYNFSNVTSFQSPHNIVNSGGAQTGRYFNQGNVIQLSPTPGQSLLNEAGKQFGIWGLFAATTHHHKLDENKQALDDYLQRQMRKTNNNN